MPCRCSVTRTPRFDFWVTELGALLSPYRSNPCYAGDGSPWASRQDPVGKHQWLGLAYCIGLLPASRSRPCHAKARAIRRSGVFPARLIRTIPCIIGRVIRGRTLLYPRNLLAEPRPKHGELTTKINTTMWRTSAQHEGTQRTNCTHEITERTSRRPRRNPNVPQPNQTNKTKQNRRWANITR